MKTVALTPSSTSRRGFSLFEVLLMLCIIGILVSLSVPLLFKTDSLYAARDRRNAQELSAMASMARAAGLDMVNDQSVEETIHAIVRGDMPTKGPMKGQLFVVPGLSEEDILGAAKYLVIEKGELRYTNSEKLAGGGLKF